MHLRPAGPEMLLDLSVRPLACDQLGPLPQDSEQRQQVEAHEAPPGVWMHAGAYAGDESRTHCFANMFPSRVPCCYLCADSSSHRLQAEGDVF